MDSDDDDRRGSKFSRERPSDRMSGPPSKYPRRSPDPYRAAPPDPYGRENGFGRRNSYHPRREPEPRQTCWDYLMSLHQYKIDQSLPEDILKEELNKKYDEYKIEFAKRQRKKFFEEHKKEEWFFEKYHPDGKEAVLKQRNERVQKRKEVYDKLLNMGAMIKLELVAEYTYGLLRLMDSVIVFLEDGTRTDFEAILDRQLKHYEIYREMVPPMVFENEKRIEEKPDSPKTELHETQSLVFTNFPLTQTKNDLEALGKARPFFCRAMLTDVVSTREGLRRKAYLTFRMRTDIKEVCLKLNNLKLGPVRVVDNSLQRIRVSRGPFDHKPVTEAFLYKALQLICKYDRIAGLYTQEGDSAENLQNDLIIGTDLVSQSSNPLVIKTREMIPDSQKDDPYFLNADSPQPREQRFEFDEKKVMALDSLAFYLRIVHSFDLYFFKKYEDEDLSMSRLGNFHVRCPLSEERPPSFCDRMCVEGWYVYKTLEDIKVKMDQYLLPDYIGEEELLDLGWEDPEAAVQKFIADNTQELGPEKWLCPLSGKKFKSSEFVLKHLTSKHGEALDGARKEATYWNNYLRDKNRPLVTWKSSFEERDPPAIETRRPRHLSPPRRFQSSQPKFAYRDLDAAPEAVTEVPNIF